MAMNIDFDIRSAMMIAACLNVMIAIMLVVVGNAFPRAYQNSLRWWWVGLIMQPAGFILIALRGVLPSFASIVVANIFIATGFVCFAIAMRIFTGVKQRRLYALALVVLAGVIATYFSVVNDQIVVRTVLLSFIHSGLLLFGMLSVYRSDLKVTRVSKVLAILFLLSALVTFNRGMYYVITQAPINDLFSMAWPTTLTFSMGGLLPVVATVGFLLMCTEDSQKRLERMASEDYLTGVYNRRALSEFGAREIARSRRHGSPLSLILLDIDFFKSINDELGHAAGDAALIETVKRLKSLLRSEDYLGRMGGEEFIILLPDTNASQAMMTANRIQQVFSNTAITLLNKPRPITLSGGIALLSAQDIQFDDVLRRADQAMYLAKMMGRNRMELDPQLNQDEL
jgi:diguanylate cyclase (GGDEF)-like protein